MLAFRWRCFWRLFLGHPLWRLLWPSGSVWGHLGVFGKTLCGLLGRLCFFCLLALILELKLIFSGLGGRWPALVRPLFQVFTAGCVFYACLAEIL